MGSGEGACAQLGENRSEAQGVKSAKSGSLGKGEKVKLSRDVVPGGHGGTSEQVDAASGPVPKHPGGRPQYRNKEDHPRCLHSGPRYAQRSRGSGASLHFILDRNKWAI